MTVREAPATSTATDGTSRLDGGDGRDEHEHDGGRDRAQARRRGWAGDRHGLDVGDGRDGERWSPTSESSRRRTSHRSTGSETTTSRRPPDTTGADDTSTGSTGMVAMPPVTRASPGHSPHRSMIQEDSDLACNSFPALNRATFFALILMTAPVWGCGRYGHALLETEKVPKPTRVTLPPPFRVFVTASTKESKAAFACVLSNTSVICKLCD